MTTTKTKTPRGPTGWMPRNVAGRGPTGWGRVKVKIYHTD